MRCRQPRTENGGVFPSDFLWGAAVAAYQIEGAVDEDGRGESIWDRFSTTPGAVVDGHTGAVACDSYHRYREDVRLLRELGVDAFRFSISWPRVFPDGRGPVNRAGLDFYDRYVDELLGAGIEPVATLYHWDLPQALEDAGGWPRRDTAERFAEFVEAVAGRLGDRVPRWVTVNEPWEVAWLGYGTGEHAPGRKSEADALAAAHHVLLAHGLAVDVLRRTASSAQVGVTIDLVAFQPLTASAVDVDATRRLDGSRNRWILDPVLRGSYPEDVLAKLHPLAPPVVDGDMQRISAPIDFLGINYYTRNVIQGDPAGGLPTVVEDGAERTEMGWEVYPRGLFDLLVRLRDEYDPPPILVTENGAAYPDERRGDTVDDPARAAYVARHVDAIAKAIAHGVPVEGYFVWSLLDNFEWAFGYSRRFGLVYVDFATLERVPKTSYRRYRDLIADCRQEPRQPAQALSS
jgi:beta-glucosidase